MITHLNIIFPAAGDVHAAFQQTHRVRPVVHQAARQRAGAAATAEGAVTGGGAAPTVWSLPHARQTGRRRSQRRCRLHVLDAAGDESKVYSYLYQNCLSYLFMPLKYCRRIKRNNQLVKPLSKRKQALQQRPQKSLWKPHNHPPRKRSARKRRLRLARNEPKRPRRVERRPKLHRHIHFLWVNRGTKIYSVNQPRYRGTSTEVPRYQRFLFRKSNRGTEVPQPRYLG